MFVVLITSLHHHTASLIVLKQTVKPEDEKYIVLYLYCLFILSINYFRIILSFYLDITLWQI